MTPEARAQLLDERNKVADVLAYCQATRGVGHTTAALQAAEWGVLLVCDERAVRRLKPHAPNVDLVPLSAIEHLRGMDASPLVIDHAALAALLGGLLRAIDRATERP